MYKGQTNKWLRRKRLVHVMKKENNVIRFSDQFKTKHYGKKDQVK